MAHTNSPQESLFSQVIVGVLVSVLTAASLKGLGLAESDSTSPVNATSLSTVLAPSRPAATVRVAFAAPEPLASPSLAAKLPPPEAMLFDCAHVSNEPPLSLSPAQSPGRDYP